MIAVMTAMAIKPISAGIPCSLIYARMRSLLPIVGSVEPTFEFTDVRTGRFTDDLLPNSPNYGMCTNVL